MLSLVFGFNVDGGARLSDSDALRRWQHRLDADLARALATVGNTILKGFEVVDVRKQLAAIERLLQERS